ncbi:MAG: type II toxin-antitoxin system VapC family toxin [Lyngbya sp. HA4199-MV5]|jgi:tRNA(fMet)-specific endonuclease VapC|nr:type II toxin-antitoxin system VapC family toxin [Lyngbya sp. HA4199-MV5]
MSVLLVDTDVVSFLFKQDSRAESYATILQGNQLALSFMTVAEPFQWAAIRKWGESRTSQLERSLTNYLIIPVDVELCRCWGNLRAELQIIGKQISAQDAWIAATAIRHNLPLVSHNAKDFSGIPALEVRTCS